MQIHGGLPGHEVYALSRARAKGISIHGRLGYLLCSWAMRACFSKPFLWVAALWCLAPWGVVACVGVGNAAETPPAHALEFDIGTEHIPWAKPLAAGPVRVLLVAPRHTLRDGAEFAQRFEVDLEAVALWDRTHLGYDPSLPETHVPGGAAEEVLARLKKELDRNPDVVILANFALDTLPLDVWSELYRRVAAGMGLVLVNHDPPEGDIVYETFIDALSPVEDNPVNYGVGADTTAEWAQAGEAAFAAEYGEGRVVTLGYGPDRPATHCLIPALTHPLAALPEYFDNYLALMGRAVLWAAGHDTPLRITHMEQLVREGPDEEEIPPELPEEFIQTMRDSVVQDPIKRFVVSADRPAERDYTVRVQVRDPNRNGRTIYTDLPEWKKGQQQYLVEFLSGPGAYFLDLWLNTRKGVALWHTESVEVRGWPSFDDLRLSKDVLLPNDALDLSVEVRAVPGNARAFTLYARGVDNFDRVVAEAWGPAPEGGGRASLRLPFSDLIGRRVKLEVYALEGQAHLPAPWELNMAACAVRLLPVRQPRDPSAAGAVVCADAAGEYNARRFLASFRDLGADAVYTAGGEGAHRHILGLGMRPIGSVAEVRTASAAEGLQRDPCLTNETFRTREPQRIAELAGFYARGGLLDYGLGNPAYLCASDENVCQSATCLDGYRNYLRTRYGNVAELNKAWGTNFSGFAELMPYDAARARQESLFAPWVSFRMFMAATFANHLRMATVAVGSADSHARTGARLEAEALPAHGYDVPALARAMPLLCMPDAGGMPYLAQSAAPAGARNGIALQAANRGAVDTVYARWLPWRAALLGIPEIWLVSSYGTATHPDAHALLRADGVPGPALEALGASLATLNEGYGALLREATPVAPEVAVITSMPAQYYHAALADAALNYATNLDNTLESLERLGYAPALLPEAEIADSDLSQYPVIVLSMASALSSGTCEALTRFASQGGFLVADLLPGAVDDAGAVYASAPLAELFGVEADAGAPRMREAAPAVSLPMGDSTAEGRLALLPVDGRIALAGGESHDDGDSPPVWIRTDHTLLLNHPMPARTSRENAAALRLLLAHHLEEHSVSPPLPLDEDFDGMRRTYLLGGARIHALLPRWDGDSQHLSLRFEKGHYATDLLHGDGGRAGRSVRTTVEPGECALVTDLPYEVSGLEITAPPRVAQGERLPVQLRISTEGEPGTHFALLTLETGMAKQLPHYNTLIEMKKGSGQAFLPLALSEQTGDYFLRCRDLLSGMESRYLIKVVPRTFTLN